MRSLHVAANCMIGSEIFFGCLGVSAIIVALATARAIPEALRMIERISMKDAYAKGARHPVPPNDGPPWGERPR
jgi:hypothetical protein